jgi:hypothetical protein
MINREHTQKIYGKAWVFGVVMAITLFWSTGCSSIDQKEAFASISSSTGSEYEKTFQALRLGQLFDFNLQLPYANKSWVEIWVEGYKNGKVLGDSPIIQLSYGLSPREKENGQIGFGMINTQNDQTLLLLYSESAHTNILRDNDDLFLEEALMSWEYTIGDQQVVLEAGEEKVLAVYRQGENSLRSAYEYENTDAINEMINENAVVLLLKIKVNKEE